MVDVGRLRADLKRGALVTAANWPLVLIQFAADTTFKIVLVVPVLGGALLVGVAAGGDASELLASDLRHLAGATFDALAVVPGALAAFGLAVGLVLVGGAVLMFVVKGGTLAVLVRAVREAGPIERPPLRVAALKVAQRFTIDSYLDGCAHFARRFVALGLSLLVVYVASGALYLAIVVSAYRAAAGRILWFGWTLFAAIVTIALLVWLTAVNLGYVLTQMIIAADDAGPSASMRRAGRFVRARFVELVSIFGVVFVLVVVATVASILAAMGLGLIGFVPVVGWLVVPLQIAAWILRGILFQYLGLTAVGAYLVEYAAYREAEGREAA